VDIHAADEDAVDGFEAVARRTALGAAPDGVAGGDVLSRRERERDVDRDAGRGELFEGGQPGGRRRHLDHAVIVSGAPLLAEGDVLPRALLARALALRILQKRIQLEADVAVVAARLLPDGVEDFLGVPDDAVGHLPSDLFVARAV